VAGFEMYSGLHAYWFLLRVSSGLASQMRGEADIFGQIKQAWNLQKNRYRDLHPIMNPLFEDTKDLRSGYLQNLGTTTYGGVVRRLLKSSSSNRKIVILGAGQIAESVAPWIDLEQIYVYNRTLLRAQKLIDEVSPKTKSKFLACSAEEQVKELFLEGAHAVVCTPFVPHLDNTWVEALMCGGGTVIHLGGYSYQTSAWQQLPEAHFLDHVFQLQKQEQSTREDRFLKAEQACLEKARLRELCSLSRGSLSMTHGWEDLAIFSTIR
jgi:hypothetical protein